MNKQTWLDEFYPESAESAAKRGPREALLHSIRKWTGLREENLVRHGMEPFLKEGGVVTPYQNFDLPLRINGDTCALCAGVQLPGGGGAECARCPIFGVRGCSCDETKIELERVEVLSPFSAWTTRKDPEPMLTVLSDALAFADAHPEETGLAWRRERRFDGSPFPPIGSISTPDVVESDEEEEEFDEEEEEEFDEDAPFGDETE